VNNSSINWSLNHFLFSRRATSERSREGKLDMSGFEDLNMFKRIIYSYIKHNIIIIIYDVVRQSSLQIFSGNIVVYHWFIIYKGCQDYFYLLTIIQLHKQTSFMIKIFQFIVLQRSYATTILLYTSQATFMLCYLAKPLCSA